MVTKHIIALAIAPTSLILAKNHMVTKLALKTKRNGKRLILAKNHMVTKLCQRI